MSSLVQGCCEARHGRVQSAGHLRWSAAEEPSGGTGCHSGMKHARSPNSRHLELVHLRAGCHAGQVDFELR